MLTGTALPSWFDIENRLIREIENKGQGNFRSYFNERAPSLGLVIRRINNIRTAFYRAKIQAGELLRKRFADIEIVEVLSELLSVIGQMAMIVAGSVLAGGAIGAGAGAFAGGAGAVPGAFTGMTIGLQASSWILGTLGLASIAEFFVDGLPRIGGYYTRGIEIAWEGTFGDEGLNPFRQDDPSAVDRAAHQIALGHVEVAVLLLSAIVDYLTRGRGSAAVLASEMRATPKGNRLAQWMLKHEDALKKRPDLQRPGPRKGDLEPQDPLPQQYQNAPPPGKKPLGMPEYKVPCFNVKDSHFDRIPEFDRQLGGQERGLNDLTVDEYLRGRAAFKAGDAVRDPKVAKQARESLAERFAKELSDDLIRHGGDESEALMVARQQANKKMKFLAALHNPDLIAGGKDSISDFGDTRINASIGAQWPSRIYHIDRAAEQVLPELRSKTKMNAKLERCR